MLTESKEVTFGQIGSRISEEAVGLSLDEEAFWQRGNNPEVSRAGIKHTTATLGS